MRNYYAKCRSEISGYTLRKFSIDLGFGDSTILHQFIKGHRKVSIKNAQKVKTAIKLPRDEGKFFILLAKMDSAKNDKDRKCIIEEMFAIKSKNAQSFLEQNTLGYFSKWYVPLVHELCIFCENQEIPVHPKNFHLLKKISEKEFQEALDTLETMGLISADDSTGKRRVLSDSVSTGPESRSLTTKAYHHEAIDRLPLALNKLSPRDRDMSTLLKTVSVSQFEAIREKIHDLQEFIMNLDEKNPDQVVQVSLYLFNLAVSKKEKKVD